MDFYCYLYHFCKYDVTTQFPGTFNANVPISHGETDPKACINFPSLYQHSVVRILLICVGNSPGQLYIIEPRDIQYFCFPFKFRAPLNRFSSCHFITKLYQMKSMLTLPLFELVNLAEVVRQGS